MGREGVNGLAIDASAILAVLKNEAGAQGAEGLLSGGVIAAPNLTEVADQLVKIGEPAETALDAVQGLGVTVVPVDAGLAIIASELFLPTRSHGLSLGDSFCLALARKLDVPALTGDRRWAEIADEIGVRVELFR